MFDSTRQFTLCAHRLPGTILRHSIVLFLACAVGLAGNAFTLAAESAAPAFEQSDRDYWLWQPVKRPSIPGDGSKYIHPVDAFLRDPAASNTSPGEADRRTLIRRATFDLHGLPPTWQEVQEFLADQSPGAFERVVDRLLASPRYGEHWARHWLDLVRYAESDGFKSDDIRPNAWRYRDYVIQAFNEDKPYDQFVIEQLAGDELSPEDLNARVATGFLRLGPYEENGRDVRDQRANIFNDITDVTGQVFLGLTFACARCHDHKYDPILQADYFRLQAFFAGLSLEADQPLADADAQARYAQQLGAWESATQQARTELAQLEGPYRAKMRADKRTVFPDYVQTMLDKPSAERTPLECQMADLAERQLKLVSADVLKAMKGTDLERAKQLSRDIAECSVERPAPLPLGMTARDRGPVAAETIIPGERQDIPPGYLSILDPQPAHVSPSQTSSGRRLALAQWIASPQNPIPARVMVNRVFQQHFGRGIVATSEDFGAQGARPSNADLLDYLAAEFIAGGFRLKSLHRLLMTSAAYRRAAPVVTAGGQGSAADTPWWQATRRRLTAEQLRDAMLAVSGELNLQMGGPSVRGELPLGLSPAYKWEPDADPAQRNRRSIYMFSRRNLADPLVNAFDLPDSHESCARRQETTTAPQALTLLNGSWTLDRARAVAGVVLQESASGRDRAVAAAYAVVFQRAASATERAAAEAFLADETAMVYGRLATASAKPADVAVPPGTPDEATERAWRAALVDFCHVLLNSNEFMYLD